MRFTDSASGTLHHLTTTSAPADFFPPFVGLLAALSRGLAPRPPRPGDAPLPRPRPLPRPLPLPGGLPRLRPPPPTVGVSSTGSLPAWRAAPGAPGDSPHGDSRLSGAAPIKWPSTPSLQKRRAGQPMACECPWVWRGARQRSYPTNTSAAPEPSEREIQHGVERLARETLTQSAPLPLRGSTRRTSSKRPARRALRSLDCATRHARPTSLSASETPSTATPSDMVDASASSEAEPRDA